MCNTSNTEPEPRFSVEASNLSENSKFLAVAVDAGSEAEIFFIDCMYVVCVSFERQWQNRMTFCALRQI